MVAGKRVSAITLIRASLPRVCLKRKSRNDAFYESTIFNALPDGPILRDPSSTWVTGDTRFVVLRVKLYLSDNTCLIIIIKVLHDYVPSESQITKRPEQKVKQVGHRRPT